VSESPEYVKARRVLLDALHALADQRDSIVVVGAQAIYLHVGEADLAVPAMTIDADLALDPSQLLDAPLITESMAAAKFAPKGQPGAWVSVDGVQVDLMVPEAVAGRPGHRGADLGVHGTDVARRTRGLECALVDLEVQVIESLDPEDERTFKVAVAGTAALLVAKLIKISERVDTKRAEDKDALDVVRLLRGTDMDELASTLQRLVQHPVCGPVATEAMDLLGTLFMTEESPGSLIAGRAAVSAENPAVIAKSAALLAAELLAALGR
jgi:hypothetical protein